MQLSSPAVNRRRAEMLIKRLVLNIQPSPSAAFSRKLESDCECLFFCSPRSCCRVGVCAPTGLHEIVHSLAPSMGWKC